MKKGTCLKLANGKKKDYLSLIFNEIFAKYDVIEIQKDYIGKRERRIWRIHNFQFPL